MRRHRRAANCGGSCICFSSYRILRGFQLIAMMPIGEDFIAQEIFSEHLKLLGKMSTRPAPNLGVSAPTMMNFSAAGRPCMNRPHSVISVILICSLHIPDVPCFCLILSNLASASGIRAAPKLAAQLRSLPGPKSRASARRAKVHCRAGELGFRKARTAK